MDDLDIVDNETCTDVRDYLKSRDDLTLEPVTMVVFALVYSLLITVGVVGNLLVIISVMRHKSLQSVRNMFIVSLSCSDLVVSIVSGSITPITAFTKVWLFGSSLCSLVPVIQGTSLCFSTLTLTAIAIDRFILIIFPTKRPIQKSHAYRMVAVNCAIAFSISLPVFFRLKLVNYEADGMKYCGLFCAEDWGDNETARSAYGTIVFVLQFIIPLIIITFCYTMISLKLGQSVMLKKAEKGLMSEQRRAAMRRRIRTNRMLIAMVGLFVMCWTPSVAFNFLRDHNWLPTFVSQQDYLFGTITHCISMSSPIWNPCLYALLNEQFRVAFASLLKSLRGDTSTRMRMERRCSRLLSSAFLDGPSTSMRSSHLHATSSSL